MLAERGWPDFLQTCQEKIYLTLDSVQIFTNPQVKLWSLTNKYVYKFYGHYKPFIYKHFYLHKIK